MMATLLRRSTARATLSRHVTTGQSVAARFKGPAKMVTKISDLSSSEVASVLALAHKMKANPTDYYDAFPNETLLMLFEKPSLRTRVSLEVGMTELGGHAISFMTGDSPLGKKETYGDTGACLSRYVCAITARVGSREQIKGLCATASVPVVNALDDWAHPMQMLADMQTMEEKFGVGNLKGLKMAYLGDIRNNVTYDLMRSGSLMGFTVALAGPAGKEFEVDDEVVQECKALGGNVTIHHDAAEALKDADVVYTDSWQSYGVKNTDARVEQLMPFQVTSAIMAQAKPSAIFMNCLPAMRGEEQTAEVIDGPQSVVFDQAENRLHAQKALLYMLVNREL